MALPGATEFLNPDGTAKPPTKGPAGQVRASHLLVKHSGSRRPASWKDVRCVLYLKSVVISDWEVSSR